MTSFAPYTSADLQKELNLSRSQVERLETYAALLVKWQKKINLISPATVSDLWRRHMLDSAQLWPLLAESDQVIADIGSGAGFPGLVLAILSGCPTTLIESDQRKGAFLREAARVTAAPITVITARVETIKDQKFNLVTSRALAALPTLLSYAAPLVNPGGKCLFLKGKGLDDELTACTKDWTMRSMKIPSRSSDEGVILQIEDLEAYS